MFTTRQEGKSSLERLRLFAIGYKPYGEPPQQIPSISEELRMDIVESIKADPIASEKYLTLILLKLYNAHLECCNQSYELRKNFTLDSLQTPILYWFLEITEIYEADKMIEFIPSSIAYEWVVKNPKLIEDKFIKHEIKLIKKKKKN